MGDRRIYRRKRPLRTFFTVVIVTLVLALVLSATVFFGFRRYIVYTDNGVRLEVPWLTESTETANNTTT